MPVNFKDEDIFLFKNSDAYVFICNYSNLHKAISKCMGILYSISHPIANIHVRKYVHTAYMGEGIVHINDHYQLQLLHAIYILVYPFIFFQWSIFL